MGEPFVDNQGDLYFCITTGTPGTWKKVLMDRDDGVGANDLAQVNATIIAGVLIFLTVSAFGTIHVPGLGLGRVNMTDIIFLLTGIIVGLLGGSLMIIMLGRSLRIAKISTGFGIGLLIFIIILGALLLITGG